MDKKNTKEKYNFKQLLKRLRDAIRNISILYPFRMTGFLLMLLFVFAFLFCWLGGGLESGCLNPFKVCTYLYYKWSTLDGLSLLCGYMGVAATVILGLVTLRFSFKVDERELIGRVRKLKIRQITLYDMYEDFVPCEMRYPGSHKFQFLLKLELETEQSSYELSVDSFYWGKCKEDFGADEFLQLKDCEIYVTEAKDTTIQIYFNEFGRAENSCAYFYHLGEYEPLMMKKHLWNRRIRMDIQVEEKIWIKNQEPRAYPAVFELQVENSTPKKSGEHFINLQLISHKIELLADAKKGGKENEVVADLDQSVSGEL